MIDKLLCFIVPFANDMLRFSTVVCLLNSFQCIENRFCKGFDGKDVCCLGFSLNEKTGKCEKCSIGYYGKDCAKKCSYPVYGEDCQLICDCSIDSCHFSQGCLPNVETLSYQQLNSTKTYSTLSSTTFSTNPVLNETVYFPEVATDFSKYTTKISDTTHENYLHKNNDLLKDNLVTTLFGFFVLICSIFVIAYIYFKCQRINHNPLSDEINQAQYKMLSLAAIETQSTAYPEQQVQSNADPTYLSPVFSHIGSSVILDFHENNENLEENTVNMQRLSHDGTYTESEATVSLEDQTSHIYNELHVAEGV